MKAKILIPLLFILSVCTLKAQVASTQYFQQAFEEISAMLEGKKPLDFERAVFITENAYRENSFKYEDFKSALDIHSAIIEQFIKANDKYDWKQFVRGNMGIAPDAEVEAKERYRKALANYAIFTYLTDTLTVKLAGQDFLHLPYTYSNEDPFGTADWKNSQTINLLETQKGNCYSLVTLFKIFSERFKSEANIVTAPQHIYIEHLDPKGSRFNVEVATRSFPDFGSIQTLTYTTREALLNDISMRKLDLKQSIGLCLVYLAKGYEYKNKIKDDEFILSCANTALQHDPKNLNALLLKAQVYEQRVMRQQMPSAPYEKMLADLYKLGYRQMPDEMKEIILSKIQDRPSSITPTDKTWNTFEGIGEQARVVTLSNGLFEEMHPKQKIVKYGQTIFDTEKSKIVKFLDEDISSYQVDPVVFALSVDPLTKSYPWYTPYQFAGNMPVVAIDLDGLEPLIATDYKTMEELNKVIKITYSKQVINSRVSAGKEIHSVNVQQTFGGTTVEDNLHTSEPSQEQLKSARDGGLGIKLIVGATFPQAAYYKGELEKIEKLSFRAKNEQKMALGDIAKSFLENSSATRGTLENTYLHTLGQGFITILFGEGAANFSGHLHERIQEGLITGNLSNQEIGQAIDNYSDLINNQWGQLWGNEIKAKFGITSGTEWTPELTAGVLNEFQNKLSSSMGINFNKSYSASNDTKKQGFVEKLTEFINKNK
jgi:hypothetical protein